jgi:Ca-activated chloride channel family protein
MQREKTMTDTNTGFAPRDAATGKELALAMQSLWLSGAVTPAGARLIVRHEFASSESRPLEVVYAFALLRDAALRRFEVAGEGFNVHSELKPVDEAVKQYEEGIAAGSLSTLARQYRDGVVNLTLGNLRPGEKVTVSLEILAGVELRDDGLRFRFPFTLAPAYHSRARFVAREPGVGEMELPSDEFGDVLLPPVMDDASGLHRIGFDVAVHMPEAIREIASPSHAIRATRLDDLHSRVSPATESDVPNRDLVLDVRTQSALCGVLADGQAAGSHFVALIPSSRFGELEDSPRRVVFVIDRSGSMQGAPMAQAKKAVEACLATLTPHDQFGIVAFDNCSEVFHDELLPGDAQSRQLASKFLAAIDARGGTELVAGCAAAAKLLGRGGGDLLVMTDGQVSATEDILKQARGAGIRLHTLGIGSASQDRFLTLLARETGGVSHFATPRERVDMAAVELFASVGRPVASGIRVSGVRVSPEPAAYVFAGSPLVLFGELEGSDRLTISWVGCPKPLEIPLSSAVSVGDDTIRLLHGSRLITDLDARLAGPLEGSKLANRERERMERALEALSTTYGLASRRMALVAVIARTGDRVGEVPKTEVVPVGMPQDVSFDAYFGGASAGAVFSCLSAPVTGAVRSRAKAKRAAPSGTQVFFASVFDAHDSVDLLEDAGPITNDDILMDLACRLQPDGGLPGKDDQERLLHSLVLLAVLLSAGHTPRQGALRTHVARLVAYLESLRAGPHANAVQALLDCAGSGTPLPGDWWPLARQLHAGHRLDASAVWDALTAVGVQPSG